LEPVIRGALRGEEAPPSIGRRRAARDPVRLLLIILASIGCGTVLALLAAIVWLSFASGAPGDPALSYGLRNYVTVFGDPFTYRVLWNTAIFAAITLCMAVAVALPIAWLMERSDFPGKPIVFTLITTSLLIPGFATALGWIFLLHPRIGLINKALMALLGLERAPFDISSILGMGIVEGLSLAPITFIMTAIGLRAMNPALEEAALMSGATPWTATLRVTLPVLWPTLLAALIYVAALSFAAFDVPAILGLNARIFTFSTLVYQLLTPSEGAPRYGNVAALSLAIVLLALLLSSAYRRVQANAPRYAIITGKSYRPRLIRLGRVKAPAIAFVALYFVISQLMPLLMLGWAAGLPYLQVPSAQAFASLSWTHFTDIPGALLRSAIANTILLMLVVPTATLALSVAISWVVLRARLRWVASYDFLAFLPVTVPHIVFSLAALLIALFVLRDIVPIYGTIWILIIVNVIGRMSYGTRMTNGALIQIHHELEEQAHIAGAGTAGTLRSVLLPLMAPTLLYAWIWIALLTYRELTLPVMLSTSDTMPFSVLVWGYVQASQYGPASAASLIMLALMLPILLLYWVLARRVGIADRPT
jgi:iron(III) transport system permease protein